MGHLDWPWKRPLATSARLIQMGTTSLESDATPKAERSGHNLTFPIGAPWDHCSSHLDSLSKQTGIFSHGSSYLPLGQPLLGSGSLEAEHLFTPSHSTLGSSFLGCQRSASEAHIWPWWYRKFNLKILIFGGLTRRGRVDWSPWK